MSSATDVCPYCKGTQRLDVGYEEKVVNGKRSIYMFSDQCYCVRNERVGLRFPLLAKTPDATPEDAELAHKDFEGKNLIFLGDEDKFRYLVKSYFLRDLFSKDYMILEGITIVDKYHAPQNDGTRLTIANLEQYTVLVILFTSYTHYDTMQGCINDTIKNRLRLGRPTWVFAKTTGDLEGSREYSAPLKEIFEGNFTTVNVGTKIARYGYSQKTVEVRKQKSKRAAQQSAAGY